jgi:hypothetical protein
MVLGEDPGTTDIGEPGMKNPLQNPVQVINGLQVWPCPAVDPHLPHRWATHLNEKGLATNASAWLHCPGVFADEVSK